MLKSALERGRTLNARLQVRGFDAIAQLVAAGLGVAVLPSRPARRASRKLFDGQGAANSRNLGRTATIYSPRAPSDSLPAAVQRFVDALCPPSRIDVPRLAGRAGPRPRRVRELAPPSKRFMP